MPGAVVTPGNHDGVHLGHRALVRAAQAVAAGGGLRSVALFFDPHPSQVLAPERAAPLLTTAGRRRDLLVGAGVDAAVAWPFDEALAAMPPEAFVERVLLGELGARHVVTGPDFRFGADRRGDLDTLRRAGLPVTVVEPVLLGERRVSSTWVRERLEAGDVVGAAELLARVHDVRGTVVEGDGRGRTLGFRTANLDCEPVMLPANGVYAVVARLLGRRDAPRMGGVANLGVRPTFGAGQALEVHLFDFDEEVYGSEVRIGFVARIRPEQRFEGLEALRAQIGRDVEAARAALGGAAEERVRWV